MIAKLNNIIASFEKYLLFFKSALFKSIRDGLSYAIGLFALLVVVGYFLGTSSQVEPVTNTSAPFNLEATSVSPQPLQSETTAEVTTPQQVSLSWRDITQNFRGKNIPMLREDGLSAFSEFRRPTPSLNIAIDHKTAVLVTGLGYNESNMETILSDLPLDFGVAINPYAPYANDLAQEAFSKGYELWLHVPARKLNSATQEASIGLDQRVPAPDNLAILYDAMDRMQNYVGIYISKDSAVLNSRNDLEPIMGDLRQRGLAVITANERESLTSINLAGTFNIPLIASALTLDDLPLLPVIVSRLDEALADIRNEKGLLVIIPTPNQKMIEEVGNWLTLRADKRTNLVPVSALPVQ